MIKSLYIENSSADLGKNFLNINNTLTFFFYMKLPDNITQQAIISQNNGSQSEDYRTQLYIKDTYLNLFNGIGETITGTISLEKNKWYCITYVLNKKNSKIYINGELCIDKNTTNYSMENTWLFSYSKGSDRFLNGYISEFKIYNYAMTQDEIKNKLWKVETDYSQLLRYYNFHNVIDNHIILDSIGNYNLIINGFKYLSDDIPPIIKFLIKQNNNYIAIKSEFYKELGQPLTDTERDEWFEKYGTDNLSVLTTVQDKNTEIGVDKGNIGEGKYFEIPFKKNFLNVSEVR